MKHLISIFILLLSFSAISCDKSSLKYDFSKIKSQVETNELLRRINTENKDAKIDTVDRFNEITVKGMHYDGVPIKSALITDHYTVLTTDTLNYSGKQLLEALEAKNGLTKRATTFSDNIQFTWKSETENKEFNLKLVNGKHLAALSNKDYAELTITYNKMYDIPLANIHKEIKPFENQHDYQLKIDSYECVYDIILNDVRIAENSSSEAFSLNNYVTSNLSSLKIVVKPEGYKDGSTLTNFDEQAAFSAEIIDSENSIIQIEPVTLKGNNPVSFELDFNSPSPYYPTAWTGGDDLRNDKNLKEKIVALYEKLGNAILTKDDNAINELYYQKNFEIQQTEFDTDFNTAKERWEVLEAIKFSSYKFTVAQDFEIEYNAGGKLIYAYPKDKTDMLIFTGKQFNYTMNFFLYQPEGSNELKIIR